MGALPLATTDNLNFGNPEKPEIMGQFVGAIKGIGEACKALDFPIVSGNVSLYNETDGKGILPTPTIGGVGLIDDLSNLIAGLPSEGDVAIVIGETRGHLGQSALAAEAFGIEEGDAPPVDLLRPNQRLVILSDFLDDPAWVQGLLSRAAGIGVKGVLMQVLDPDEEVFPWSGAVLFRSLSGAIRHDSRDAGGLREAYLARLSERRDWLRRQATGAGWQFGHHSTGHPPATALSWLYQVLAD